MLGFIKNKQSLKSYLPTKHNLAGTLFFAFTFSLLPFHSLHAQAWKLVWSDEFDGNSINRNNWTFDTGTWRGGWGNNELEYYTPRPENATVRNGNLEIIARKEDYMGSNYTSARLKTQGLNSWTYGKVEARIKLPSKKGLWPGFWMLGENFDWTNFPYCGEIDIMEYVNEDNTLHGTMHWEYNHNTSDWGGKVLVNNKTDYHIYAIEWDSVSIKWLVDGKQYWEGRVNNYFYNTYAFHKPFFILLNLAVGGTWPGRPKNAPNQFPDTMYVDYVRVYKKG